MTSEVHMQNLLSDLTDAVINHEPVELVRERYAIPRHDSDDLLQLIQRLDNTLEAVQPSAQFSAQLKADLIETAQAGMFGRLRRLPMRVQMAAGFAIATGFWILIRRYFFGEEDASLFEDGILPGDASWRS